MYVGMRNKEKGESWRFSLFDFKKLFLLSFLVLTNNHKICTFVFCFQIFVQETVKQLSKLLSLSSTQISILSLKAWYKWMNASCICFQCVVSDVSFVFLNPASMKVGGLDCHSWCDLLELETKCISCFAIVCHDSLFDEFVKVTLLRKCIMSHYKIL